MREFEFGNSQAALELLDIIVQNNIPSRALCRFLAHSFKALKEIFLLENKGLAKHLSQLYIDDAIKNIKSKDSIRLKSYLRNLLVGKRREYMHKK